LPEKMRVAEAFMLVETLRRAGIPVLGGKVRWAGLFAKGQVRVKMSVPDSASQRPS
jgi:hypothetical protein